MRILHVITGLGSGGTEAMLVRLAAASAPFAEHMVLTLSSDSTRAPALQELGVSFDSVRFDRPRSLPGDSTRAWRFVRSARPAIVQGWLPHGNLAATAIARWLGVPAVWNVRQSLDTVADPAIFKQRTSTLIRVSARLSALPRAIVYNTQRGRTQHEAAGYSARRGVVIANGFDAERFKPSAEKRSSVRCELGLRDDAILVGLFARWHPMKDHATFLRAARELASANVDAYLLLAGRGITTENRELAKLIEDNGVGERTVLLGERADVERLTAALDVACCSSVSEGMPNTLGEAMAAGVPCVSTDVGGAADLVGDTGRIVPPAQPARLAAALRELLALTAQERRALGGAARERIERSFSIAQIARAYFDLYERVLHEQ